MSLTEETIEDKIEITADKSVQVRTATVIKRDGVEISRNFHRHVVAPSTLTGRTYNDDGTIDANGTWGDTDISSESAEVQAICNAVWTDAVKTAYQTAMDAQEI
jgi:hypothetical protein